MIHKYLIYPVLSLLLTITIVGQATDCPIEINTAFSTANAVCVGVGRNQVCYGNEDVNITPYQETNIEFDSPGDVALLNNIRTLSLSALDIDNGYWGIAVMRLLANLDPTQAEDVTMLLFGDVELQDASGNLLTQTIESASYANLRRLPNTEAVVMDSVAPGEEITITGRLADNSWVRVTNPQTNIIGWILASLLEPIDFESLEVVSASDPYFAPMQAFYFRSGVGSELDCASVPRDGMIVQTPEGLRRVTLWVNEVTIDFIAETGSTATIQTTEDGDMSIDVLEGSVYVSSQTDGYVAVAGSSVTVKKSGDGQTSISKPQSSSGEVDETTLSYLDREIEPAPPADENTINEANGFNEPDITVTPDTTDVPVDTTTTDTTTDTTTNTNTGNNGGKPDCPGNSCSAPGKSNDSKSPPGKAKGQSK